MKDRDRLTGLSFAAIALSASGCTQMNEPFQSITPEGNRIVKTSCVLLSSVFPRQPIAFACPDAIVTVQKNSDLSLTIFSDAESGGLTMPYSNESQFGGTGVIDWCSIFFEVQSGEVISMEQSCSFPPDA